MILQNLQRIAERRPYFDIYLLSDLYMRRWWLFGGSARDSDDDRPVPREWKRGQIDAFVGRWIAGRLHHIVRADRSRDLHNHPATFISFVVSGWYRERRPLCQNQSATLDDLQYTDTIRRPGSIALRRAQHRHTIVEVSPGGCWTVVIWFRKRGSWGFWLRRDGSYVNWRDYEVRR